MLLYDLLFFASPLACRKLRQNSARSYVHRNLGITSFDISSSVLRTSGMGTPPKLTMQITLVTPIFWYSRKVSCASSGDVKTARFSFLILSNSWTFDPGRR